MKKLKEDIHKAVANGVRLYGQSKDTDKTRLINLVAGSVYGMLHDQNLGSVEASTQARIEYLEAELAIAKSKYNRVRMAHDQLAVLSGKAPAHIVKNIFTCIQSETPDLKVGSLYRRTPDDTAEANGLYRIEDESGETYCYPQSWFRSTRE